MAFFNGGSRRGLLILDIANNHMGDAGHGCGIIEKVSNELAYSHALDCSGFDVAFKFQYRSLATFVRPEARDSKHPAVRRFLNTEMSEEGFSIMLKAVRKAGHLAMATPFDELSVGLIERQGLDAIKIASCSLADWPLMERVAKAGLPVAMSTAGASMQDIDDAVQFFHHRGIEVCVMHCVALYPAELHEMALGRIDAIRERHPGIAVGLSSHEAPGSAISGITALAKGAAVFERHVHLPSEGFLGNQYSCSPKEISEWASAIAAAARDAGSLRKNAADREAASLRKLRRGAFFKRSLPAGSRVAADDLEFAIPAQDGQMLANGLSKYLEIETVADVQAGAPAMLSSLKATDRKAEVKAALRDVCELLRRANVKPPEGSACELSHHFGMDAFRAWGCFMVTCVNLEFCKKIIVALPGQTNPEHMHKAKSEAFHVLAGSVEMSLDGQPLVFDAGELVSVAPGVRHSFSSMGGAVLEEISTTHCDGDSYYSSSEIMENRNRKTKLEFRSAWLKELT